LSWAVRWTYETFSNPNATCPVSGVSVFFYQSPYGGRVFFDDLGSPWPKHPCTDDSPQPIGRAHKQPLVEPDSRPTPAWKAVGWIPIAVDKTHREDEWHVLKCRRLDNDIYFRLLCTHPIEELVRAPALLSPMSELGLATISFLGREADSRKAPVYDYGMHCLSSPSSAEGARHAHSNAAAECDPAIVPVEGS
jgi:hypothetical protein